MSNKVSNFPNAQPVALKKGEMALAIKDELELATWPKVDTSVPDQIKGRIIEYLEWCVSKDKRPHVEEMALALSTSRQTLWNWSNEGSKRGEIVKWAKQILSSMHEEWGISGKLNPATYIFLAKNHFQYKDDSTLHLEAMNALNDKGNCESKLSREEISARYAAYKEIPEKLEID